MKRRSLLKKSNADRIKIKQKKLLKKIFNYLINIENDKVDDLTVI